jgi:hypothetical protein
MTSDDLEVRIKQLEERGAAPSRWFLLIEKLVLPLALALIAYFAKVASDDIAAAQVEVARANVRIAEAAEKRAATTAVESRQLKYLELFYRDLRDRDATNQQASLSLLYVLEPTVARSVAKAVVASPATPPALRQQVNTLINDMERFGPLINYRLVIYHPPTDPSVALQLVSNLRRLGFKGDIRTDAKPESFAGDHRQSGYHFRYDKVYEAAAAEYLRKVLPECLPGEKFSELHVTGARTDGALTVFLYK